MIIHFTLGNFEILQVSIAVMLVDANDSDRILMYASASSS